MKTAILIDFGSTFTKAVVADLDAALKYISCMLVPISLKQLTHNYE